MTTSTRSPIQNFQYSTTSRNGWNLSASRQTRASADPFSTQPRVETAGTFRSFTVSWSYCGTFSTQPRVETAGTRVWSNVVCCSCSTFQYSTTSRNGWNRPRHQLRGSLRTHLSVLNHESKRLEPKQNEIICCACGLSVLNHESKRLEPTCY